MKKRAYHKNLNFDKNDRQKCKNLGVNYKSFYTYKYRYGHPDCTPLQYANRPKSLRQQCIDRNISLNTYHAWRLYNYVHKQNLSIDEYIEWSKKYGGKGGHNRRRFCSWKYQCSKYKIDVKNFYSYKNHCPNLTVIEYKKIIEKRKKRVDEYHKELALCKKNNIPWYSFYKYKQKHKNITIEQYIKYRKAKDEFAKK